MRKTKRFLSLLLTLAMVASLLVTVPFTASAAPTSEEYDGSQLWMNYVEVDDAALLAAYKAAATSIVIDLTDAEALYRFADTPLYTEAYGKTGLQQAPGSEEYAPKSSLDAARAELIKAFAVLLGVNVPVKAAVEADGAVVVGTPDTSAVIAALDLAEELEELGDEGYIIRSVTIGGKKATVIASQAEIGALYGTYAFLRLIQTQKSVENLDISDAPKINHRRLNGWDMEHNYAANGNAVGDRGLNGENGTLFNWDLAVPASADATAPTAPGPNQAHSTEEAVRLPIILDRYIVFARACASVGINEITLNLINTHSSWLTEYVIRQQAALADVLRPYGIKITLAANYGMPTLFLCNNSEVVPGSGLGVLGFPADATSVIGPNNADTVNPDNPDYSAWWLSKTKQIRRIIPDFAGYTVKANSEGQPGPQNYGNTHAEGANAMAKDIYREYGTEVTVFWRSFVYEPTVDNDRLNRAYMEFGPADDPEEDDEPFLPNVFVQTKNGPLDFQPREPFHPMFGRMPNTNQAMEVQILKEYLGQNKALVFLGTMWEEVLKYDTGWPSLTGGTATVGQILDGTAQGHSDTAMVGVHNVGNAANMVGHEFDQANFFTFGRQSWDWTLNSEDIAEDWTRMTWSNDADVVKTITDMMMGSREAFVQAQEPLGLMHQGLGGAHYAPNPWDWSSQDDWGPAYYNKADAYGIGFDRTVEGRAKQGLNAPVPGTTDDKYFPLVNQYSPTLKALFENIDTCPEEFLLAFHHVAWDYKRPEWNGRTLWEEMVYRTQMGVQYVTGMIEDWNALEPKLAGVRFDGVKARLAMHEADNARRRDESVKYWQLINGLDIPTGGAPLSIELEIDGKTYGGFDLAYAIDPNSTVSLNGGNSPASALYRTYKVALPYGTEVPAIADIFTANPDAEYEVIKQAESMTDTAKVSVTADCWFGKLVQNFTFAFVYDTALKSIAVDGVNLSTFDAKKTAYTVYPPSAIPVVTAVANDPAATVTITQPTEANGVATITVGNHGAPETVYTIRFGTLHDGNDEFDGSDLDPKWSVVNADADNWRIGTGALTITTQRGDLQGMGATTNNAKNLILQDAPTGDWVIESKVAFSRAPATKNEQGGIIAYQDNDNYVYLGWQMRDPAEANVQAGKFSVVMILEENGVAATYNCKGLDMQRAAGSNADTIWFRLEKKGNSYAGYYSANGKDFKLVMLYPTTVFSWGDTVFEFAMAPATPALPSMNASLSKVGVYAFNRDFDSATPLDVSFDYFHATSLGETVLPPTPTINIRAEETTLVEEPVEYTVSIENAKRVMNATITFEVDADMLEGRGLEILAAGFEAMNNEGTVRWTQVEGSIWQGEILLMYLGNPDGFTSAVEADLVKVLYAARQLGDAAMKITGVRLVCLDDEGAAVFADAAIGIDEATTLIKEPDPVYSIYDLNKDGIIDERDLAMAQRYYGAEEGDANWAAASVCDFNEDGAVDLLDLVDLFIHFTR